jgi:hypothetical protein
MSHRAMCRVIKGLAAAAAVVAAVAVGAVPGATAQAQPGGRETPKNAPVVSETDQLAYALDGLGRTKYSHSYAGLVIDQRLRKVIVYATDLGQGRQLADARVSSSPYTALHSQSGRTAVPALAADIRSRVGVEVRAAKYTLKQLHTAREQLWNSFLQARSADVEIFSIAVPPEGTGLQATASDPAKAHAVASRFVAATASRVSATDIRFVPGAPAERLSRQSDNSPFYSGGTYITDGLWECTSGFGVRHPSGTSMVTAAHCFAPNRRVYTGGLHYFVGTVGAGIVSYDAMAIGTNLLPQVWTNNNMHLFPYGSYARSFRGQKHCQSGFWSNQICDLNVDYPDDSWIDEFGNVKYGSSGWRDNHSHTAGLKGDSGGPVYMFRSDNRLESHGIVSAGDYCSPPRPGERVSCSLLHWTLTDDILRTWGAQLITG